MEEERKDKGLSRRGFLKGLGGGAIGTAVISTGLLNVEPTGAYTPEAFIQNDGPQCGFCTSGQIMSGKALLLKNSQPSEAQARRALSGNLCRCGNYNREVAAVLAAAKAR